MSAGKRSILIAIVILLIISVSACNIAHSPYIDTTTQDEPKDMEKQLVEEPTYGGSITIPMLKTGGNPNPITSSSGDVISIAGLIYESLIKLDDELKPAPALAESWKVSDDGKRWTLKLRDGVKWHDGAEVSIEDVIFSIDLLKGQEYSGYYIEKFNRIKSIENITIIEPDTLYIKLSQPESYLLEALTFPILPKHIYNTDNKEKHMRQNIPIGTGPFKVEAESYNLDKGFTLLKNNNYWAEKPYLDKINVKIYERDADIINDFQAGEVDILDTSVIFADIYTKDGETTLHRYLSQIYEFLAINHDNPILQDDQVRKALMLGIDRKKIIKEVVLNNAEVVDTPIYPKSWLFEGTSRIYDCDIDVAIELLENADWHDSDGDGIRDKTINGRKVDLSFKLVTNIENDLRKDVAESIKLQLEDTKDGLGIQIDIELLPWEEIVGDVIEEGDFDLLLIGQHMPETPDLYHLFGSEGEDNFMKYKSPKLDKLILRAREAVGDEDIKSAYRDIQRYFIEKVPVISLYFPTNSAIISEKIGGKVSPREFDLYNDIQKWYVRDNK